MPYYKTAPCIIPAGNSDTNHNSNIGVYHPPTILVALVPLNKDLSTLDLTSHSTRDRRIPRTLQG